jgi:hypothetical protein
MDSSKVRRMAATGPATEGTPALPDVTSGGGYGSRATE